jgi:hypothetical protein
LKVDIVYFGRCMKVVMCRGRGMRLRVLCTYV